MKIFISWNNNSDNYVNSVIKNGHTPITDIDIITECDGVIMLGGGDVNPIRYGEELTLSKGINDDRDNYEFDVMDKAISLDMPILGICRGCQLINVYFGGTLYQDLKNHEKIDGVIKFHTVKALDATMKNIYADEFTVNSYHHQAIKSLAPDFKKILISDDGITEGIIHKEKKIIAMQWHPEKIENKGVDGNIFMKKFYDYCKNGNDLFDYQR